jgi:DNA-binding FadR family transcriptional regulator
MLEGLVRHPTLATRVADQLERLIVSGKWPVGSRLTEKDLSAQLGVGRNTVREALVSLVRMGLCEARVGDGTYVRALSELEAAFIRRASRASLGEALEIRAVLEQAAAKLAAKRRSAEDVVRLRELIEMQRQAGEADDADGYAKADDALHRTIVASTGNELLTEIYQHLGGALKLSVSPELWNQAVAVEEVPLHQELVEAIAAQDADGAESAAARIISVLRKTLMPATAAIDGNEIGFKGPETRSIAG